MWEPQIKTLSRSYRCIVPDLWGHGRSDSPPKIPYSIESLAEDHWAFANALGLERFAVIGLSIGGMWGGYLTLNHPEAVAALVLMDTYLGPEPEDTRARYFRMLDAVEQAGAIQPPMQEAIAPLFFSPITIKQTPDLINRFKAGLSSTSAERIPGILGIGRGIFSRASMIDRLSEIDVPTLVIVGADDLSRPLHEAQQMAEAIPGAHLEVIAGAGHISNLEQPERVTDLLGNFLKVALSKRSG